MTTTELKSRASATVETLNVIWNIIWGFLSYIGLALSLFWEEYGETIQVGFVKFVFNSIDLAGKTLLLGQKSRRTLESWLSRRMDSAFFQLVDVQ